MKVEDYKVWGLSPEVSVEISSCRPSWEHSFSKTGLNKLLLWPAVLQYRLTNTRFLSVENKVASPMLLWDFSAKPVSSFWTVSYMRIDVALNRMNFKECLCYRISKFFVWVGHSDCFFQVPRNPAILPLVRSANSSFAACLSNEIDYFLCDQRLFLGRSFLLIWTLDWQCCCCSIWRFLCHKPDHFLWLAISRTYVLCVWCGA